ncbi:hypothetical protein PoB_001051300 [Plakobranchus ocellatus]|uniref:Uncharacterized protein n=1 Tax=Plakobranchus ocellatus TaxID=259542 RepID=A0AAV3YP08_9GAST|nr:hypothetical protein PoB_001051300 [Plakobranchus ocellatus]
MKRNTERGREKELFALLNAFLLCVAKRALTATGFRVSLSLTRTVESLAVFDWGVFEAYHPARPSWTSWQGEALPAGLCRLCTKIGSLSPEMQAILKCLITVMIISSVMLIRPVNW